MKEPFTVSSSPAAGSGTREPGRSLPGRLSDRPLPEGLRRQGQGQEGPKPALAITYIQALAGARPVRFISPNVEAATGHRPAAFLDDPDFFRRQLHPDDLQAYLRGFDLLRRDGSSVREYRLRCRDGLYRRYRDELHLTGAATARPEEFVGCLVEIPEGEEASRRPLHEEALSRVPEACPVVLTLHRAEDGTILYENPAADALFKQSGPEPGRSVIPRWASPEDYRAHIEQLRRQGSVEGLEVFYRKADEQEFWCALSARLVQFRGEEAIVSSLFDLTGRRAAETELARQREILHQSEKLSALGELLAGVSHELNNPFSVLIGQTLLLKEKAPDDKVAARAEKIGKAAERCARIVKSFLNMAHLEPSEMALVDLSAIIEQALEEAAAALRSSEIQVSLRMAKALPQVLADAGQMRQVFANLIANAKDALQAMEGPRRLRITCTYRKQSDQLVVKVKDNGPGVPAEIGARIFEPLYTTKETGSGTGIGLALCHRIVEAHCGSIVLERGQGEGAIFAVRVPAARTALRPAAAREPGSATTGSLRVLVADRDQGPGAALRDLLEGDGHSVDTAASGYLALQKIRQCTYDVILSNVSLPGMEGAGFYRALAELRPESIGRLAFITADRLGAQSRAFLDAAERPYLERPISQRQVRDLVDLLVRS